MYTYGFPVLTLRRNKRYPALPHSRDDENKSQIHHASTLSKILTALSTERRSLGDSSRATDHR